MQEQYNHKDHFRAEGDVIKSPSASEISLRDSLIKLLRDSGIEVIDDVEEGQRVLAVGSSAEGVKKLNDLDTNVVRYQMAYHGSANDFDAFDTMSHLSEGEGNQAFGAGTYVADQKDLGVQYANIAYDNNHIKQTEHWNARRLISRFPTFEDFLNNPKTKEAMAKNGKTIADLKVYYENSAKLAEPPHVLYTLDIPDDNGKNYLDWDGWLSRKQADTIRERLYKAILALNDDYKGSEKYLAQDLSVIKKGSHIGDTYGTISDYLGSDKSASEFLHDLGYTGIKVHAAHNSNDVRYKDNWNYVIFNDKDLKIKDKIRFFRTSNGDAYGFTSGGKIYIDPRIATAETPIHEYAHLWGEALRKGNPEEWKNVVELMKQETVIWDDVKKNYPHLASDDDIADEVLATYSGRQGAKKLRALRDSIVDSEDTVDNKRAALSSLERFRQLFSRLWKDIADLLHIHFTSAEEVADKVMIDLLNGLNPKVVVYSNDITKQRFSEQDLPSRTVKLAESNFYNVIDAMYTDPNFDRTSHVRDRYDIGSTPDWMKNIGISGDYFSLSFKNIKTHQCKDADHDLTREEWYEVPEAIQHPFLVTKYKGASDRFRLYVNMLHNGHYVAVGIDVKRVNLGKNKPMLDVNSIKTVFAKGTERIAENEIPIAIDKNITPKQQALLHGHNFHEYPTIQELSIAKIGNISDNNVNKEENFSVDSKIRFQFIGERGAENIDRSEEHNARIDDLRVAREMEAAGKDGKTIKMATGWERGADGKWRYEIGDGTMKSGWEAKARVGSVALSDVIDNEELFTSFPQMRNISVALSVMDDGTLGWYNSLLDRIELNDNPSVDLQGVLLHEIQHAIQHAEGFEPGTNTERTSAVVEKMKDTYWKEVDDIEDRLAEVKLENNIDVDMEKWLNRHAKFSNPDVQRLHDEYRTLTDKYFQIVSAEEMYHRNAGEVESRNVTARRGMSSSDRRKIPAWVTEDVAREDQLFLKGKDVPSTSAKLTEEIPPYHQINNNQHMDKSQSIAMAPLQPRLTPLYHAMEYSLTHDGVWMLPTHRQNSVPSSPFVDLMMVLKSNHDTSTLTPKQTGEKPQLEQSLPNSKKIYFDALALARQVGEAEGFRVERYFKPMDSQYDPKSDKVRYTMIPTKDLSSMPSTLGAVRANDLYRAVVSAIGGHDRLDRQSRLSLLTDDASKHELLVRDIAAGVLMSRQGLPAVFSKEVKDNIAYYEREIKENPSFEASLMKDVDSTMKALDLSIKGERVDYAALRRPLPSPVDQRNYSIVQDLAKFPNSESREVIVIKDKAAGMADVILPQGASKRVWDEAPGLHKDDLTKALEKNGITKVSYYNSGGSLRLMQPNDFFKGKEVLLANYSKQSLNTKKTLDLSAAIRKTHDKVIEKFRCIKDDNGKYVFFLKPEGEKSFSVYPSKEQRDRFFTAAKEDKSDREKIRYDICQETYRYAKEHPEAKREVIMPLLTEDIDLSKIRDVSLKREESSHRVFIEAKINGEVKRQPVTPQQWERLWLADDMQAYKNNLAANIFAPYIKEEVSKDEMENSNGPELSNGSERESTDESEEEEEVHRPALHL